MADVEFSDDERVETQIRRHGVYVPGVSGALHRLSQRQLLGTVRGFVRLLLSRRLAQLLQGDLRLGLEADIFRHAGGCPAARIVGPLLGQIQPIGNGQAALVLATDRLTATWQLSCLPN